MGDLTPCQALLWVGEEEGKRVGGNRPPRLSLVMRRREGVGSRMEETENTTLSEQTHTRRIVDVTVQDVATVARPPRDRERGLECVSLFG